MHTGRPVLHRGKVRGRRGLPVLEPLHGPLAEHGDGQAGGAPDGLLAGRDHAIEVPLVKGELLAANTAHTIDDDERLRRHPADQRHKVLQLAQHAGRGVDVRDGQQLVLLLAQRLFDLGQLWARADGGLELRDLGTVGRQGVGEAVTEVARVQNQGVLAGLDEVGADEVPTEGAGTGDDEGLGGGVGGPEKLAEKGERLAEGRDEAGASVALAGPG